MTLPMSKLPLFLLLSTACSDYELTTPNDPEAGAWDDGGDATNGDASSGDLAGDDSDGLYDDPSNQDYGGFDSEEDRIPDEFIVDDCADGTVVRWLDDEVAVLARDTSAGRLEIDVPVAGIYHLYDLAIAESGASQWNESANLRIRNAANPEGRPLFGNCGDEWVVVDSDNFSPVPQGTSQYMGTFELVEGINVVKLRHYCWLYLDGECTQMHFTDHASSTCETNNPNSVHMGGGSLCLRAAGSQ